MLMADYFNYYNYQRRHRSIDDQVPSEYYQNELEKILNLV
jgi:transposase InsO family protein